jgi:hypothetical protein
MRWKTTALPDLIEIRDRVGDLWFMPNSRRIPDELLPELLRMADVEMCTDYALAEHLRVKHGIECVDETVRRALWRERCKAEMRLPVEQADPLDPAEPDEALQRLRYQLAVDASTMRCRVMRNSDDDNAHRLYLGLQSLRVRVLLALRARGAAGRGAGPQMPDAAEGKRQPVARFMVNGKPLVMPS